MRAGLLLQERWGQEPKTSRREVRVEAEYIKRARPVHDYHRNRVGERVVLVLISQDDVLRRGEVVFGPVLHANREPGQPAAGRTMAEPGEDESVRLCDDVARGEHCGALPVDGTGNRHRLGVVAVGAIGQSVEGTRVDEDAASQWDFLS